MKDAVVGALGIATALVHLVWQNSMVMPLSKTKSTTDSLPGAFAGNGAFGKREALYRDWQLNIQLVGEWQLGPEFAIHLGIMPFGQRRSMPLAAGSLGCGNYRCRVLAMVNSER